MAFFGVPYEIRSHLVDFLPPDEASYGYRALGIDPVDAVQKLYEVGIDPVRLINEEIEVREALHPELIDLIEEFDRKQSIWMSVDRDRSCRLHNLGFDEENIPRLVERLLTVFPDCEITGSDRDHLLVIRGPNPQHVWKKLLTAFLMIPLIPSIRNDSREGDRNRRPFLRLRPEEILDPIVPLDPIDEDFAFQVMDTLFELGIDLPRLIANRRLVQRSVREIMAHPWYPIFDFLERVGDRQWIVLRGNRPGEIGVRFIEWENGEEHARKSWRRMKRLLSDAGLLAEAGPYHFWISDPEHRFADYLTRAAVLLSSNAPREDVCERFWEESEERYRLVARLPEISVEPFLFANG